MVRPLALAALLAFAAGCGGGGGNEVVGEYELVTVRLIVRADAGVTRHVRMGYDFATPDTEEGGSTDGTEDCELTWLYNYDRPGPTPTLRVRGLDAEYAELWTTDVRLTGMNPETVVIDPEALPAAN